MKFNDNRIAHLPEQIYQVIFGQVEQGLEHGLCGRWCDDLLWLRRVQPPDR